MSQIIGTKVAAVLIRFERSHGTSKTPPHKPYDMRKAIYMVPARDYSKVTDVSQYNRQVFGYDLKEIDVLKDDALLSKFELIAFGQPCELFVAPDPEDLSKNVLVDVHQLVSYEVPSDKKDK